MVRQRALNPSYEGSNPSSPARTIYYRADPSNREQAATRVLKNMTDQNLSLTNKPWFSPLNVIYHFKKLVIEGKIGPGKKFYKKCYEAFVVAISLIGISKVLGREFWMQIVDDKEGSPDIRTGCYDKKIRDNDFAIQDVEVVTYDDNSPESLVDFLLRTKLSDKKGYDRLTTILCHIHKMTNIPSVQELNRQLLEKNPKLKSPVMILGKIDPVKEIYYVAHIYPTVNLSTTFNLIDECKARKYKGVLVLNRAAKGALDFKRNSEEKHYPFENLGLI